MQRFNYRGIITNYQIYVQCPDYKILQYRNYNSTTYIRINNIKTSMIFVCHNSKLSGGPRNVTRNEYHPFFTCKSIQLSHNSPRAPSTPAAK